MTNHRIYESMSHINEIKPEHIERLSATQLTELLHKLLHLEVYQYKLEHNMLSAPYYNITVPDGGEDARLHLKTKKVLTNWIRNKLTIFQVKKSMPDPIQCKNEILTNPNALENKQLKLAVKEIINENGCYTFFTASEFKHNQITRRIDECIKAIKDTGVENLQDFTIEIYDANQITHWVNNYISAVTFVQECNGLTRYALFQTWQDWQNDKSNNIPYRTNQNILDYIDIIQNSINSNKSVRISGHSGSGKTRLVLEAFRPTKKLNIKILCDALVYIDLKLCTDSIESISGFIINYRNYQHGVIVIDNCSYESHNILLKLISNQGNFKLITISPILENKFDDALTSNVILKHEEQEDIVLKLITNAFGKSLTHSQATHLGELAEGYPALAMLFIECIKNKGVHNFSCDIKSITLKKMLFNEEYESLKYEVIRACSAVSKFGFYSFELYNNLPEHDVNQLNHQTAFIRENILNTGISDRKFYEITQHHNFLNKRGRFLVVKPTALAINLAKEWWRNTPLHTIKNIFDELKNSELGIYFMERLSQLEGSKEVQKFVESHWGIGGDYVTREFLLSEFGLHCFYHALIVNPIVTVKSVNSLVNQLNDRELLSEIHNNYLVWAIERLCFRSASFDIAAKLMYRMVIIGGKDISSNPDEKFLQLFQTPLPGTEADLSKRLGIIEWGLQQQKDVYTEWAIKAMGRGLAWYDVWRSPGAENQGSRMPLDYYYPTSQEILSYWQNILEKLVSIGSTSNLHSALARKTIAFNLRIFIEFGQFKIIKDAIEKIIESDTLENGLWNDAIGQLQSLKIHQKLSNPTRINTQINSLIKKLTPSTIKGQLILQVIDRHLFPKENTKEDKKLAIKLANNKSLWQEALPILLTHINRSNAGVHDQSYNFGQLVGELCNNKQEFLNKCFAELEKIQKPDQMIGFVVGFVVGAKTAELTSYILDIVFNNSKLSHLYLRFLNELPKDTLLNLESYRNIFLLVNQNVIPIAALSSLRFSSLNEDEVIIFCNEILTNYSEHNGIVSLVFDILFVHTLSGHLLDQWNSSKNLIMSLIASFNIIITEYDSLSQRVLGWFQIVIKLLNENPEEDFVKVVTMQLLNSLKKHVYCINNSFNQVFMILLDKYFNFIWDIIIDYVKLDSNNALSFEEIFVVNKTIFDNECFTQNLLSWQHSDISLQLIASIMPIYNKEQTSLHPFARQFIEQFWDSPIVPSRISGLFIKSPKNHQLSISILKEFEGSTTSEISSWAGLQIAHLEKTATIQKIYRDEVVY